MKYWMILLGAIVALAANNVLADGTCASIDCGNVKEACFATLDLDPVTCGLYYGCHCNNTARVESASCPSDPCGPGCPNENCDLSAVLSLSTGKPQIKSNAAPGLSSAGYLTVLLAKDSTGAISYNWWNSGQGGRGWTSLGGVSTFAPAITLNGTYAFIVARGVDGKLYLNQGEVAKDFVGWQAMNFTASTAPSASSSATTSSVAATDHAGNVWYTWWQLGRAGNSWQDIGAPPAGASKPAISLVKQHLFVIVRGADNVLYINQGELGAKFVGWRSMGFKSTKPPAAASSGSQTIVVAADMSGHVFYTSWKSGKKVGSWVPFADSVTTNFEPAVSLSGKNAFVAVTDPSGSVKLNQGELGGAFTGWR